MVGMQPTRSPTTKPTWGKLRGLPALLAREAIPAAHLERQTREWGTIPCALVGVSGAGGDTARINADEVPRMDVFQDPVILDPPPGRKAT